MKQRTCILLLCAATAATAAEINNYAERVGRQKQVASHDFKADLPTREAADNIARAYLGLFEDVDISSVKDQPETLKALFDASDLAAFYTDSAYHARKMQLYFDLLEAAGDKGLPSGPYMLVAASVRCHFSLDSMRALQDFQDLDRLTGRSKWLMRMERHIDFARTAQWNKVHTAFQFSIPRNYPAWTAIDRWDTPTFYFFNSGKLVYQFAGWPKQGNMENIKRGMREAGFYDLPR